MRECAVVGVDVGGFEGTTICCAFSVADGVDLRPLTLRVAVSELLPAYMLPTRWRELDTLPKNVNGKIDRNQLKSSFTQEMAAPGRPVVGS